MKLIIASLMLHKLDELTKKKSSNKQQIKYFNINQ